MSTELTYGILFLLWAAGCFFFWKKDRHRDWLWFTWVGIAAGAINLIDFFLKNIVQISSSFLTFNNSFIRIFDLVAILLLIAIILRISFKK
jgi:hypothetical protein